MFEERADTLSSFKYSFSHTQSSKLGGGISGFWRARSKSHSNVLQKQLRWLADEAKDKKSTGSLIKSQRYQPVYTKGKQSIMTTNVHFGKKHVLTW